MKKSRYSDSQILGQSQAGRGRHARAAAVPRARQEQRHVLQGRAKYGGMDASMVARLKESEEENRRLKKMYAEERLKAGVLQEAMAKKW